MPTKSPYNIVIALDSFKGSLDSLQACKALHKGLQHAFIKQNTPLHCTILPISDGGDGLLTALISAFYSQNRDNPHTLQEVLVTGPYGEKIQAQYLLHNDEAILEMAQSTGLTLTPPHKRRAIHASSYGLGEMMLDAYTKGAKKIILGVGGSATNDGGAGCLQALGIEFYDNQGRILAQSISPKDFNSIKKISGVIKPNDLQIEILCDVENTLLGSNGATYIYGTQKGILQGDLEFLESQLTYFADVIEAHTGKKLRHIPKSGAAGGIVFGLSSFCSTTIQNGAKRVLELIRADEIIQNADLVITGEGCLDKQSSFGKAPIGIAQKAFELGTNVIGVAGTLGKGYLELHKHHLQAMFSIVNAPMSLQEAMENGEELLKNFGQQLGGILLLQNQ
ncbi:glycerate kinase [Helicobacter aurati]|nr:glycerate kinase [Helicobacter aurati]